jgi:tyrosine-protein kinase Etk/Wzc
VVDAATPPERKSKPKRGTVAVLATLAAAMLLLVWVFVQQALQGAALNPESAAKLARLRSAWGRALGRR